MRQVSKTEQEKNEILEADRREGRKGGFKMMGLRDSGAGKLRDYMGGEITMFWHVDRPLEEGEIRRSVPDGMFVLNIRGKEAAIDAEEFRRYLRWA